MVRRLVQLAVGIAAFGAGVAMIVRTVAYAGAIGPIVGVLLPVVQVPGAPPGNHWPRRASPVK